MNFGQESLGYGVVYSNTIFLYIFVFLIGGYISLHQPQSKMFKYAAVVYLLVCFALSALQYFSQQCFHSTEILQIRGLANNSIPLFTATCLFLWFYTRPSTSSLISKWAVKASPYILGVYLIHDNGFIRAFLWDKIVQPFQFIENWYLVPYCLTVCAVILVLCILIDWLRKKILPF